MIWFAERRRIGPRARSHRLRYRENVNNWQHDMYRLLTQRLNHRYGTMDGICNGMFSVIIPLIANVVVPKLELCKACKTDP